MQRARRDDAYDELPLRIKLRVYAEVEADEASSSAAAAAEPTAVLVKVDVAVAAALSRPLAKMLVGPMASLDRESNVLSLGQGCGLNPAALRSVVEFMYTGQLELTAHTTFDVLSATNFLELDSAKALCA